MQLCCSQLWSHDGCITSIFQVRRSGEFLNQRTTYQNQLSPFWLHMCCVHFCIYRWGRDGVNTTCCGRCQKPCCKKCPINTKGALWQILIIRALSFIKLCQSPCARFDRGLKPGRHHCLSKQSLLMLGRLPGAPAGPDRPRRQPVISAGAYRSLQPLHIPIHQHYPLQRD